MLIQFTKDHGNKKAGQKCRMISHIAVKLVKQGVAVEVGNKLDLFREKKKEEVPEKKSIEQEKEDTPAAYDTKVIRAKKKPGRPVTTKSVKE